MENGSVEVVTSWFLTNQGMFVELKHSEFGISQGTTLKSCQTEQSWIVLERIFFSHTSTLQKRFAIETESVVFISFRSLENLQQSKNDILEREKLGIYQFKISPVQHTNKPIDKEILVIEKI